MMRRLICTLTQALLPVTLALLSHQSSAELAPISDTVSPYVWVAQTATHAGRVRVTITKTRPKLQLAKSRQPVAQLFANDDNNDYYDDQPDVQVGYRRPELIDQSADLDLSDEIKIRLALSRMKALRRYTEVWS